MLAHLLNLPRMKLYLNFERTLAEDEITTLREFVKRRGNREPLQHIIGASNFCGYEFLVNRHVLIPRPETELLAERAWKFLQEKTEKTDNVTALDFGTGSGCLAVMLAIKCPDARIHALDVSPCALAVARENATRHKVFDRIIFHEGDGFAAMAQETKFDLIVCNPPYIASEEVSTLEIEVKEHDPKLALDGGPDGLNFFRMLADQAASWLKGEGSLMMEFGEGQAGSIREIFERQKWIVQAEERDYSHRERFVITRRSQATAEI